MANTSSSFPNFTPLPSHRHSKHPANLSLVNLSFNSPKRLSPLLALNQTSPPPINVGYLAKEFGGRGVAFEGIGDDCAVTMQLDNGSTASLVLPSGLVTSYKPRMWHGSTVEVLHTAVDEGESGEAVIRGGISMDFKCMGDDGSTWPLSSWALGDIRRSSENYIQVELISNSPKDMVEVKYMVTLHEDLLASELTITSLGSSSPLQFSGSIMSHLTVSTPEATYTVGLQGSNYRSTNPTTSKFSIIPPNFNEKSSSQSWVPKGLQGLFSNKRDGDGREEQRDSEDGDDIEGEEKDDYAQLTEKMSRIYTFAPREFTLIDRGRRNSIVVRRSGLDELYVLSPGSNHEMYGRYAYICIGPAAILTPIVVGPGDVWKGGQYLYNPSL